MVRDIDGLAETLRGVGRALAEAREKPSVDPTRTLLSCLDELGLGLPETLPFGAAASAGRFSDPVFRSSAPWAVGLVLTSFSPGGVLRQQWRIPRLPDPADGPAMVAEVRRAGRTCFYVEPGERVRRYGLKWLELGSEPDYSAAGGAQWAAREMVSAYLSVRTEWAKPKVRSLEPKRAMTPHDPTGDKG